MRISISRKFVEGLGYRVVTKKGGVLVGYYGSILDRLLLVGQKK
ncbi:hypothetical protein QOZ95_000002 [Paenibacillus brasilensis]|uniref:Uncharacterized protein n=1 Tax=Paenibacillus brasilensis TaxID=128574 RepID=A0ABU0KQZ9_9BACL|nr:hypothetical protein [Paenibacillus brasilensis]